jgi:multisubunit Na+/H+ antiporter MnhB subunit
LTGILTETVARLLLAPSLVIAVAILVDGYRDVGDGFSAGVIAALGVLLQYAAFGARSVERRLPVRFALPVALTGLALAAFVAFLPLLWREPPLTHYPRPGEDVVHIGALELLTAFAFDAGVFLLVFGSMVAVVDALARAEREPA